VPTYEFRCPDGHDFEHFFPRISDAASVMPCPTCGVPGERRISAGGGLLFKGSGFYITDYGKDGKKDRRAKAPAPDAGPAAKPAGGEGKASGSDSTGGAAGAPAASATSGKTDA
jgi:putative FmdB family regulatory protein